MINIDVVDFLQFQINSTNSLWLANALGSHGVDKRNHSNDVQPTSSSYVIGVFCDFPMADSFLKIGGVSHFFKIYIF